MTPTRMQTILASDRLPAGWSWMWAVTSCGATLWSIHPSLSALSDLSVLVRLAMALGLAFVTGWSCSIIPAWFVFGPILYAQGLENSAPFVPGDRVYILTGVHRGRVTRIDGIGQHGVLQADLGEQDRKSETDLFGPHQLLRDRSQDPDQAPEPGSPPEC